MASPKVLLSRVGQGILDVASPQPAIILKLFRPTSEASCLIDASLRPSVFRSSFSFPIGSFGVNFDDDSRQFTFSPALLPTLSPALSFSLTPKSKWLLSAEVPFRWRQSLLTLHGFHGRYGHGFSCTGKLNLSLLNTHFEFRALSPAIQFDTRSLSKAPQFDFAALSASLHVQRPEFSLFASHQPGKSLLRLNVTDLAPKYPIHLFGEVERVQRRIERCSFGAGVSYDSCSAIWRTNALKMTHTLKCDLRYDILRIGIKVRSPGKNPWLDVGLQLVEDSPFLVKVDNKLRFVFRTELKHRDGILTATLGFGVGRLKPVLQTSVLILPD
jgi:hypothetical protein